MAGLLQKTRGEAKHYHRATAGGKEEAWMGAWPTDAPFPDPQYLG